MTCNAATCLSVYQYHPCDGTCCLQDCSSQSRQRALYSAPVVSSLCDRVENAWKNCCTMLTHCGCGRPVLMLPQLLASLFCCHAPMCTGHLATQQHNTCCGGRCAMHFLPLPQLLVLLVPAGRCHPPRLCRAGCHRLPHSCTTHAQTLVAHPLVVATAVLCLSTSAASCAAARCRWHRCCCCPQSL
jgi:hypothetical protein